MSTPSINYTVKELLTNLHEKMDKHGDKLDSIEEQTIKTNGRVTKMESNPFVKLGNKAQENPFKFIVVSTIFLIIFIAIVISDFRHPLLEWLIKLFPFI
ncbi:MAG: hypothetical protein ACTSU7_00315 [Candidatus Heimdallarchaeaceae archaeon]